ncbi:hypothetical protein LINPERPRIM_LOCUS7771 [Linum perenne]
MFWYCSHCLRSCPTMSQGDFISCSECGKVLGDRTSASGRRTKRSVKKVGSKRVEIVRKSTDGNDTDDSNVESEESSSS